MNGYNHVVLVGQLASDPEEKAGKVRFTLAVSTGKKKDDDKTQVDFINVVACNNLGKLCSEYLEKGRRVLVDGELKVSGYELHNQKKWRTEVQAENITFLQDNK